MQIIDEKFKRHKLRYVFQCLLATAVVMVILMLLDAIQNAVVVAALGASAFVAFATPHARVSRPRFLLGGYLVGVAVGTLCDTVSILPQLAHVPFVQQHSTLIFGATAVGLSMFIMVVIDTEHPPAAALALGFVLGDWNRLTIAVVLMGILSLVVAKVLLGPILTNLIETKPLASDAPALPSAEQPKDRTATRPDIAAATSRA